MRVGTDAARLTAQTRITAKFSAAASGNTPVGSLFDARARGEVTEMFYKGVAAAVAATIVGTMSCMPADARTKPQKRYEVRKPGFRGADGGSATPLRALTASAESATHRTAPTTRSQSWRS